VRKVSIIPRGLALGVDVRGAGKRPLTTGSPRSGRKIKVASAGGRGEVVFGEIRNGAESDSSSSPPSRARCRVAGA